MEFHRVNVTTYVTLGIDTYLINKPMKLCKSKHGFSITLDMTEHVSRHSASAAMMTYMLEAVRHQSICVCTPTFLTATV